MEKKTVFSTVHFYLRHTETIKILMRENEQKPVSSEISDFNPCAHAQTNILHIKYAEKTDD